MPNELASILAALERDMSPEVGAAFAAIAARYFAGTREGEGPVSTASSAAELAARFDEPLPERGATVEAVASRLERDVVGASNRFWHPMYMGHQVSAPLPAAVWAESVTAALNQSLAVAEMSPAATAIEHRVIRWMTTLVGWGERSGGTLTSGGTEATFAALLAARSAAVPDVWRRGVGASPPAVLCGEHAHYAVSRAVGEMGLGLDALHLVPSREFAMDVDALRERLDALDAAGRPVMAVVATAGSTATGSFDDLEAIGRLCEERGLWLHVDAAHGGSALLSRAHRSRLRGIERARSIAWDPHKMMLLPLSVGMVLVREERDLEGAFAQRAPYLFHGDGGEQVLDQGVRSFQCSRRADVIKLWVALQRYGASGIAALHDGLCETARALYEEIGRRDDFVALHAPQSNILCFRYVGEGGTEDPSLRSGQSEALDAVNRELRERYNRSGAGWITATNLAGRRVLRVTMMNPRTTREHVRALLDGLAAEGSALVRTRTVAGATSPSDPTASAAPATAPGVPPAGSARS